MRARIWSFAALLAIGLVGAGFVGRAAMAPQEKGGQEEFGPYELVENWPQPLPDGADGVKHAGLDLGVGRRRVCRDAGPNLDRAARRAAAARGREAVDAVQPAAAAAHRDGQYRRPERDL